MSIFAPPITGDTPSTTEKLPPDRDIASLWRRIAAFIVDGLMVGVAGTVIALPFFETFSHLGPWGRLVGFCISLPYFAILDSSIGEGQTLGKRFMRVQVVDGNGDTISLWRSVLHYCVFAVPYFLNQLPLPTSRTPWIVSVLISLIIFGVGGGTLYLVIFNRHTRQGIHDLAAGSYVADADKVGPLRIRPIWRMHWLILGSLLVALSLGTGILSNKLAKSGTFSHLLDDVRLIELMAGVQSAGVQDLTWSQWGGGETKKIFVINVYWTGNADDEQAIADQVAKLILEHDSKVYERDVLKVVMIRGYDLGIAHAQVSNTFERTPADWNTRLFGTSPAEGTSPAKL